MGLAANRGILAQKLSDFGIGIFHVSEYQGLFFASLDAGRQ